jgi:hypothetical protein
MLAMAMLVVLTVVVGSMALASRTTSGTLGALRQGESRGARDAAEAGLASVISELNREQNRKLLVTPTAMNSWSSTKPLQNPCLSDTTTYPSATAVAFTGDASNAIAGDSSRSFKLKSVVIKNGDRSRTFASSSDGSSSNNGSYSEALINLADANNIGYIELTVEGTYKGAISTIRREYQIVPKCCKMSFGSGQAAHGNDIRTCDSSFPRILIGLNGGGVIRSVGGNPDKGQLRVLSDDGLTVTAAKPPSVLCVSASSICGSGSSPQSIDGVPVTTVDLTLPPLPSYPSCPTGQTCSGSSGGFTINNVSVSDTVNSDSATQSANNQDYLRVNASNQVELCNVTNNNTTWTNLPTPNAPASFVAGSCTTSINNFCARLGDGSSSNPYSFHCRLRSITANDDRTVGNVPGCPPFRFNTDNCNRVQNNTLWIDSSRAPINLYFNNAWSATGVSTANSQADGQIQQVYCATPSDAVPCGTNVLPSLSTRVVIYSDSAINVSIGDDGYIRDLFFYMPNGQLSLNNPSDSPGEVQFGFPAFRGSLWVNNLNMNCNNAGNPCNNRNGSGTTQIAVPPASTGFFGLGNSANLPFTYLVYDWVARSSSAMSLF